MTAAPCVPTVETLAVKFDAFQKLLDERYEVYKADQARLATELSASHARQNEWRQTLLDQNRTFVTIDFYTAKQDDLVRQLDALRQQASTRMGKEFGSMNAWMMGVVLLGLAINIALHFVR
jgi:hypothetical protein